MLGGKGGDVALLNQVRDAFGVDDAVHQGCVDQVGSIADALDAELVMNLTGLRVTLHAPGGDDEAAGSVLAMVEVIAPDSPEASSKRALAKKLCKAVAATASSDHGSGDLAKVRSLLAEGADPNMHTGRRGSAMSIAATLNQPALTTLLVEKGGDPSLERNSRLALSRFLMGGSSGVFETVPVKIVDGVARFPDEFMIPIPAGAATPSKATLRIEFWQTNASPPSARPSQTSAGGDGDDDARRRTESPPGGKRKAVLRRFFRSRARKAREAAQMGRDGSTDADDDDDDNASSHTPPTKIVIEKGGAMIAYMGAVRLDVGDLALGKPQDVKLSAVLAAQSALTAEVTVRLSADLSEIRRKRRKQHNDVLEVLVVAAAREFWNENLDEVFADVDAFSNHNKRMCALLMFHSHQSKSSERVPYILTITSCHIYVLTVVHFTILLSMLTRSY